MNLIERSINQLINSEYACSCGKTHIAEIENIAIGKGALDKLESFIDGQKLKDGSLFDKGRHKLFLVSDVHTRKVAGEALLKRLQEEGYAVSEHCFLHEEMHAADEYTEELKAALPADTDLILAVGSGTINDLTRYVAFHAGVPYYIIATAPSMDGYASNVSPLIHNNLKTTFICACANAIIGDTDVMATCPTKMIGAGLGDIIGKYIAINDWRMSHLLNGEYCCEEVCDLVLYSVQKCVDSVPGLVKRDSDALQYLMESLVLIGIAMSYIGFSRPASSSEHHIAHFLEMKSIFRGEYGELHGTNVGLATCIVSRMYQEFLTMDMDYSRARMLCQNFDHDVWKTEIERCYQTASDEIFKVEEKAKQNNPENVLVRIAALEMHQEEVCAMTEQLVRDTQTAPALLESLGGLTDPCKAGVQESDLRDILRYAKELRDRYAALQVFYDLGVLDQLIDRVIGYYYGE